MFTTGIVFAVLAAIHVLILLMRAFGIVASRKMIKWTENSTDPEIIAKREDLRVKAGVLEKSPTAAVGVLALAFLTAAIAFFYFQ